MPGLAKSMVASFYYNQNKDLCQITFKGRQPSNDMNIFRDVEFCKEECKTDKHNYEEIFTEVPATNTEGLVSSFFFIFHSKTLFNF